MRATILEARAEPLPKPGTTGERALKRGTGGAQGYTTYAPTGLPARRMAAIRRSLRAVHSLRDEGATSL